MRIVLDTNIFISGLLGKSGPPGKLLRLWTDGAFMLITSAYQLDELRRVMNYSRLRHRITPEQAAALLDNLQIKASILERLPVVDFSPDPDDNPILASAIAGAADIVVSGDKSHMVALEQVEGIPIITPREALTRLESTP